MTQTCGGIVGHAPSVCTLHEGHSGLCEWQRDYRATLPDGTKLFVTTYSGGDVQLAAHFPDGTRTSGAMTGQAVMRRCCACGVPVMLDRDTSRWVNERNQATCPAREGSLRGHLPG